MLVQATNRKEKIVMGLLSLTCKEETIAQCEETMNKYRDLEGFEIYLYRVEEEENYVGLLGLEFTQRRAIESVDHSSSQELTDASDKVEPSLLEDHPILDTESSHQEEVEGTNQKMEDLIIVHRISVIPSYEEDAIALIMLAELEALFPMHTIELSQEVTMSSAAQLDPALWSRASSNEMTPEVDIMEDQEFLTDSDEGETNLE